MSSTLGSTGRLIVHQELPGAINGRHRCSVLPPSLSEFYVEIFLLQLGFWAFVIMFDGDRLDAFAFVVVQCL